MFSVGGCWGQPRLLFWKLVLIIKMSTSQDFKTTLKYILTCIFLSLRAELLFNLCYEIPCTSKVTLKKKRKWSFWRYWIKVIVRSSPKFNKVQHYINKKIKTIYVNEKIILIVISSPPYLIGISLNSSIKVVTHGPK